MRRDLARDGRRPAADRRGAPARGYRDTFRRMNAAGLTGAHVMLGSPAASRHLPRARGARLAHAAARRAAAPGARRVRRGDRRRGLRLRGEHGRRWRAGSAKFFIDGVVETGTAWLYEPDMNGRGTAPFWPDPSGYAALVAPFARAGFQCITHAVGDRAVRARSTPTGPRARRRARATASSTSRRCRTTTCRASPPRASSPACSRSTWRACAPTAATLGAARSGRSAATERSARAISCDCGARRRARLRLAGRALRPAPRHGLGAPAPRAGHPERGPLRPDQALTAARDARRLHDRAGA